MTFKLQEITVDDGRIPIRHLMERGTVSIEVIPFIKNKRANSRSSIFTVWVGRCVHSLPGLTRKGIWMKMSCAG